MDRSGLEVAVAGEFLDRVHKKTTELRLIAKAASLEVMHQRIRQDSLFDLSPAAREVAEVFYILAGECAQQDSDGMEIRRLGAGSCVWAVDLKESAYFKSLTELELLYVSSQPVFSHLSDQISELVDMARRVDEMDHYTAAHCERLHHYSALIGERLGLPPHRMEHLIHAAILHDVGKSGIPSHILAKPGPLSPDESRQMQRHAILGAELVAQTYLKDTAKIIAQHHERYDGTGYPAGLAWPQFTLEAAIIACVDAYDAMTSDRPYRQAMSPSAAIAELRRGRGHQFHPAVVDALLSILEEESSVAPARETGAERPC